MEVLQTDQILFIWVHAPVCLMQQAKLFFSWGCCWEEIMPKSRR